MFKADKTFPLSALIFFVLLAFFVVVILFEYIRFIREHKK